jgi:hypothetical protein
MRLKIILIPVVFIVALLIAKYVTSAISSFLSYKILPSSGLLCGVRWFETDVSELSIGPIFKDSGRSLTLEY